jgi:ribulose-bisphosphate carboxylase large chain
MSEPLIEATYIATHPDRDPEILAEQIAREQSLEIVPELIPDEIRSRYLGRVLEISELGEERWALRIGFPAELASAQAGQLLHLLYGNVSFYPRIRLVDLRLPDALLDTLPGPLGGIERIRTHIGVRDRPLLMTVLKPRGSSPEHLAEIAGRFARGGGDLIKDDQNLVEGDIQNFTNRINLCTQELELANEPSGKRCIYLPHVAGSGDHLRRQLEIVKEAGLAGVVMCPWVMGLETAASAAREFELMWLAHPAMAGAFTEAVDQGIASPILLGKLLRVAGADISIFPGSGGRISSAHDDDQAVCRALTEPLGQLRSTLPCLGGGKTLEAAPESRQRLGIDHAVLVGGDLLKRGETIEAAVRETLARF